METTGNEVIEDNFKPIFKYYKSKAPPPKLDKVIDVENEEFSSQIQPLEMSSNRLTDHPFLRDSDQWKAFKFKNGVHVIKNCFKNEGIEFWTLRCLKDYSQNINNLKMDSWWQQVQNDPKLIDKLRWATLGYHHDWDTKVYSKHSDFPQDLADLSIDILSHVNGLIQANYKPEAAIINYYPMDATLSSHVDYSEPNKTAPLISISFGQSAIFLIGGHSKSIEPLAILLKHGDVLVMSQEARQSYHAVPKILAAPSINPVHNDFVDKYLSNHRINMNIRQVY